MKKEVKQVGNAARKPEKTIGLDRLAKLLDTTKRNITGLTAAGVLSRATDGDGNELRGRYPERTITDYVRYLNSKGDRDNASESEHSKWKIKKTRAEAEIAERRARQFEGQLYHGADIEFVITNMLTFIKQGLLAIPARIARQLVGKKKFKDVYEILMSEITGVLNRLAAPDRKTFIQLSATRLASQGVNLESEDGSKLR